MNAEYIPADPKVKERLDNIKPELNYDFSELENDVPYKMTDPIKIADWKEFEEMLIETNKVRGHKHPEIMP